MNDFHHLLVPQPGRARKASSFGRYPEQGSNWCGFRHMEACIKRILLAAMLALLWNLRRHRTKI
jgi:hypothetical protein